MVWTLVFLILEFSFSQKAAFEPVVLETGLRFESAEECSIEAKKLKDEMWQEKLSAYGVKELSGGQLGPGATLEWLCIPKKK